MIAMSIFDSVHADYSKFHSNLKVLESMTSTELERIEARSYLSELEFLETKFREHLQQEEQMKELVMKMESFGDEIKKCYLSNALKLSQVQGEVSNPGL